MFLLIFRLLFDPRLAAVLVDEPRLIAICERESDCQPVGIHKIDRRWSKAPQGCSGDDSGWSTRGSYGTMARFTMRYLPRPIQCEAWVLDIPLVAAYAAAKRMNSRSCLRIQRCFTWANDVDRAITRAPVVQ